MFTVTLSSASGRTVTVGYSTVHGTTSAGDFSGAISGTVTFNPGDTSEQINVSTVDDMLDEADTETFSVNLSGPSQAILGDPSAAGAIGDNDNEPQLSIGNAGAVMEGATGSFQVTLSASSGQTVTVDYAVSHVTTVAADFTGPTSGTLTFAPGDTSETISIATNNDTLNEASESFTVTLSAPVNAGISDGTGTGSITDNDPMPTVSIANATAVTEGGIASFPVTLSVASGQTVTVNYSTSHGTTSSADLSGSLTGTVTFSPGDTSEQIQLSSVNDVLDEDDSETFTVNLSSPSNATIADGAGAGTLSDDDPMPAVSIADAATVTEGGLAMFTVTLSAASGRTVSVGYTTAHGTTSGADFSGAISGTVTFNPGDTSEQINVSTFNDTLDEADLETFSVNLSGPSNAILGDASGAGSIGDNDSQPSLSIGDAGAVAEGAAASFQVTLSASSGQTVTVNYATSHVTTATADFTGPTSGTVTFAPGDTSETISVGTNNDALNEANESFSVLLSSPVNATISDGTGTGSITDNDPLPSLSIGDAPTVTEGADALFPVTLSAPSGQSVTVGYSTANGSAVAPGDYDAVTSGSVTFLPGETSKQIQISTNQEALDEFDVENFTVTLSGPSNATIGDGARSERSPTTTCLRRSRSETRQR